MTALMKSRIETGTGPFVMCVGAAALDLVLDVETLPAEDGRTRASTAILAGGGPAATAAVAISRLGRRVSFVGSVGSDDVGELIREGLARENVDVSNLRTIQGRTSPLSAGIVRSASGSRTLIAYPGSAAEITVTPEVEAASRAASWIHADHAGFAVVRELRRRGVETLVSIDGGNPIAELDLSLVDLYAPAAPELLRWTGTSSVRAGLARACDSGVAVTIATHGETGSTALSVISPDSPDATLAFREARSNARPARPWTIRQPGFPVAPGRGSTLGAGDVFHGALLAALLSGRSIRAAMAFASAAASLSCRAIDGRSAIPTSGEVDRLIQTEAAGGGQSAVAWS
jgi:sugar/nucleoside kinase (ribokinase family)